jgi:ATP-binding cassette, subfamily B, multidrug efflux pump
MQNFKAVARAIGYMRRYWKATLLAFGSLLAATLLSLTVPPILRDVVDHGLPRPIEDVLFTGRFISDGLRLEYPNAALIFQAALLLLGLGVLRAAVAFGQRYFGERLSHYVGYDIRDDFYNKVQHLPFSYHDQSQMGQIITRAITDVDAVRTFLAQGLIDSVNILLIIVGTALAMLAINARLTVFALIPIPIIALVAIRMGFIQTRNWTRVMEGMGGLSNLLEENVIGIQVLQAYNREPAEARHWAGINQDLYYWQVRFTETWSTYFPLMAFLVACSTALMLWAGAPQVIDGTISIGTIVALNGYILLMALPVQRLGFVVQQFSSASSSAKRVFEVIDTPLVLRDKPDAVDLPRIQGNIRFENVRLHYRPNSPNALHEVSFEVAPDQVIGIVGPTGGGKTSIINLIPRFYDVTGGRIMIDGHDVRDVTLHSLRSQIGIVLQETLLFTASIRDNIRYGHPDATDEEIIAAAKAADAHRFISEMPDGYETLIGERGVTLSGGQRQRVAIARALLIDPRILILDDSTSSVDTRTESSIQEALQRIMQGRVTFIIAQRLSSVLHADQILVIEGGRIVQRGNHADLIAQPGAYQELYRVQLADQERVRAEIEGLAQQPD